jgi:hypothetical protein
MVRSDPLRSAPGAGGAALPGSVITFPTVVERSSLPRDRDVPIEGCLVQWSRPVEQESPSRDSEADPFNVDFRCEIAVAVDKL